MSIRRNVAGIFLVLFIASAVLFSFSILETLDRKPGEGDTSANENGTVEVVAGNLDVPWGVSFLPSGDMLVTERPLNFLAFFLLVSEYLY